MTSQNSATIIKLSDSGQTVVPSTDDVRGRKVRDKDGKDLGTVHDLLIDDEEHKVRFLLVDHGGFLGFGEKKSFIPVDAVTEVTEDDVVVNQTREHVAGVPAYEPELVDDRNYPARVYSHYGYEPFWGVGYSYSGSYLGRTSP